MIYILLIVEIVSAQYCYYSYSVCLYAKKLGSYKLSIASNIHNNYNS